MSSLDYLDLCRLCLVKDQVSVSIFDDGESKSRHIYPKIVACLSVKVDPEDKLPKKICDGCAYKLDLFYDFYNTTATAEKQLWMWLEGIGLEDKQNYIANDMNSSLMKQEQGENRLNVAQASAEHQNMSLNMIDNMGLTMPIIMSPDQAISVPISSSETVQTVQSIAGPSLQSQMARKEREDDEETTEDDNTEDEIDHDEGLPVKEEHEDGRIIEPTTFVNVTAMACDEAGPSGLQQKLPEMTMQAADVDPKSGEAETFGGLSGMLRQILSPSPESDVFSGCCTLQPGIFNYSNMLSNIQHIPMSSQYLYSTHSTSLMSLETPLDPVDHFPESHPCLSCGLEFRSASKLNYHIRTHHQAPDNRRRDPVEVKYTCAMCGRAFQNLGHLRMHEASHAPSQQFAPDLNTTAPTEATSQTFSCDHCQATFRYRTLLERHKKMHVSGHDKPYGCTRCPMRFETRTLYNHHAKTHKNVAPESANHALPATSAIDKPLEPVSYPCDSCTKQFLTLESLTSHKAVHRSRPLVCDVCGKGFTHRKYYVVHQRIHTGERPYLCAMCGKSFTQASTLTVHRRYHTGERPYTCTLCGKGFVTRTIMLNHMKKH